MRTKIWVGIAVIASVLIINSCENKSISLPSTHLSGSCDTTNLTYSSGTNTMKPIIDAQCGTSQTSCHSTGSISGYDYTSYAALYSNYQRGLLYGDLFQGTPNTMPKTAQAGWSDSSACMLAKFKAWMDAGAPQ